MEPQLTSGEALLNVDDACAQLLDGNGNPLFSKAQLYRATREGQQDRSGNLIRLPSSRIGRTIYVSANDVFAWARRLQESTEVAAGARHSAVARRRLKSVSDAERALDEAGI